MRDLTDEINALALDNADSYDLILINSIIFRFQGQLDSVHETGVYAVSLTYDVGRDEHGAPCPQISFGFNTESNLEKTNADRYDYSRFLERTADVTDVDGAIDMWLKFKGYDMSADNDRVLDLMAAAVRKMHDTGAIDEIFFRDIPVIVGANVSREKINAANEKANGNIKIS
ncbi:MAG: hypothetical protein LIO69_08540 [Oscillospiraceae bacterium]|nr:hypothetical protein [Oscillospiraceae bacterium]